MAGTWRASPFTEFSAAGDTTLVTLVVGARATTDQ
jgi:hypothetical protein